MTGPAPRHWLTGFVLAALAHLVLAVFLLSTWRETPPDTGSAEAAGLEIRLFPGFDRALQAVATDAPVILDHETRPPDAAAEPIPSAPLIAPDAGPQSLRPATTERIAALDVPPTVAAEVATPLPAPERPLVPETVLVAEALEAVRAPELLTPAVPTPAAEPATLQTTVQPPTTSIALAAEPIQSLAPVPARPLDPAHGSLTVPEPEPSLGILPADPLMAVGRAPVETIALALPEIVSSPEQPLLMAAEDTPGPVVTAVPMADAPTAAMYIAPERIETLALETIATSTDPTMDPIAAERLEPSAAAVSEVAQAADIASADTPSEAVPLESVWADAASIPAPPIAPIEPLAITDTIETIEAIEAIETIALLPEAETVAGEVPLSPAATERGGPEEPEDRPAPAPPSPEASTTASETPGVQDHFFGVLRDWLDRHKDYPRVSQRRGEEGTVVLAFTMNRHGMVLEHAILRSSGYSMLDNTVEHLIRRAQPLPAIPPEMNAEILQVIVPIEFRLER